MRLSYDRRSREGAGLTWRPMSAWSWMLGALAAVVITAFVVTTWLLAIAGHANPRTDRANSRLDAVRTGLAAGAGAGAAVGLMLAFRRQHHQEIATDLTNRDAIERRITELYTKAVEQPGNDKAPVRLGGLYALERLAQDNPAQRQTIVNVICAYLRMPFAPEAPGEVPDKAAQAPGDIWQQERQVRLTAQRILADHLRVDWFEGQPAAGPPGPGFWPDMHLDLTGATLIELNFYRVVVADARFAGATFAGTAHFYGAVFGGASFHDAKFTEDASFSRAVFTGRVDFSDATIAGKSWFSQASFGRDVDFNDASFGSDATFYRTNFDGLAEFQPTTFSGDTMFAGATFDGSAWFSGTIFASRASFGGATFTGDVTFQGVDFGGDTDFSDTVFADGADRLPFKLTRVLSPSAHHVWPAGWRVGPEAKAGHLVVRVKQDGRSSS